MPREARGERKTPRAFFFSTATVHKLFPPASPFGTLARFCGGAPLLQVIQLYEMIVVRHGLMLVGPTGGGKSSNLHVLEETLSRLKQMGKEVRT